MSDTSQSLKSAAEFALRYGVKDINKAIREHFPKDHPYQNYRQSRTEFQPCFICSGKKVDVFESGRPCRNCHGVGGRYVIVTN